MRVFIGFDASQIRAWNVSASSLRAKTQGQPIIERITMSELQARDLYRRPTELRDFSLWDVISAAPMSTAHAIARFFVPYLCDFRGWALFADGDVLFRRDIDELWALADARYAVQVVQHDYVPTSTQKMTGQVQTAYGRKNWSSVVLWNCGHPAHRNLTLEVLNGARGRDLHQFCWLDNEEIGALPPEWNVLIGEETHPDPAIVHFTLGVPDMPGYEHQPYADEWYEMARRAGYRLVQPSRGPA